MQAVLDERDYQLIIDRVSEEIFQKLRNKYYLVPKNPDKKGWVGLKEFTELLPERKDKEWVRTYILPRPEFKNWVHNIHPGRGRRTKINADEGLRWVNTHMNQIDWNIKLPK